MSQAEFTHLNSGQIAARERDHTSVMHVDGPRFEGAAGDRVILCEEEESAQRPLTYPLFVRHPLRPVVSKLLRQGRDVPSGLSQDRRELALAK